ncbi:hypothetical protein DSM3645_21699 [Blastopirellula marina DSM 3645]|uniref:Uncharacterized protein n=1 Tax=Blastopirellula marina DSM 3645 TaxID=314230 RepID=A3ZU95_9BACT|nr:hypothetical protein DSM3645_21699 [Blastopirellula marina DSM 3645]
MLQKNDPVLSTRPLRKKTRGGPVRVAKLVTKYRRRQVVGKTSQRREPMEEGRRSIPARIEVAGRNPSARASGWCLRGLRKREPENDRDMLQKKRSGPVRLRGLDGCQLAHKKS